MLELQNKLVKFASAMADPPPEAQNATAELGRASALTMLLVLLPVDLSRGRLLLPMSDLARFQVTRGELQKADSRRLGHPRSDTQLAIRRSKQRIARLHGPGRLS